MKTLRKTAEEAYLKYANKIINREWFYIWYTI